MFRFPFCILLRLIKYFTLQQTQKTFLFFSTIFPIYFFVVLLLRVFFCFHKKKLQFTNVSSRNDLVLVTTILDELFLFVVRFFFFSVCFNNSDVIPLCHVLSVFRNYMAKINVRQLHRGKYKIENVVTRVARCFVLRWEFPAKPLHRKQVGNLSQCQ